MEEIYLSTGDKQLDTLLAMDEARGGIPIGRSKTGDSPITGETPIVLIVGAAGTGKTTLALQMAGAIAAAEPACRVFYYSLEQTPESLKRAWGHFGFSGGFSGNGKAGPFIDFAQRQSDIRPRCIHLCHFAPLPVDESEAGNAFEDRFRQASHMLKKVSQLPADLIPVFFVDSLDAISTSPLKRNDIYRLFEVFRSRKTPAIITAESHQGGEAAIAAVDAARFLADIVIDLKGDDALGHFQFQLEVSKSRVCRQALGKHIYKIRTRANAEDTETEHSGIVVYPSIPCVLSQVRKGRAVGTQTKNSKFRVCEGSGTEIFRIMEDSEIRADACFALMGPTGTHKLALAMNLATGWVSKEIVTGPGAEGSVEVDAQLQNLLIVSFGESHFMNLAGVAWFKERQAWRYLQSVPPSGTRVKSQVTEYIWKKPPGEPESQADLPPDRQKPKAKLLTFRIGHLTPEECVHRIQSELSKDRYSAVLICNTAEICTGFPLLRNDPLFLPTLIDLLREHGLVSVCIGVHARSSVNQDMDFALQSCADYRISLAHYPGPDDLAKQIIEHKAGFLKEQVVSVVIDNVTGKHYGREPTWLWVVEEKPAPKFLRCGEIAEYQAWVSEKEEAASRTESAKGSAAGI